MLSRVSPARFLERFDKALRRRWYPYFAWRRYRDYQRDLDETREPLIVHQMGKVGSSTVVATLERCCEDYRVFQTHLLRRDQLGMAVAQQRKASRDHRRMQLDEHLLASRYLQRRFSKAAPGARWTVISMVRDPVARNISAFFQAFDVYFSKQSAGEGPDALDRLGTKRLRQMFLEEFGRYRHELALTWFQSFLEPVFGIDVYATPFDKQRGYSIYEADRCRLLLLRTEDLRRALDGAIEQFLGVAVGDQVSRNVSSEKRYSEPYQAFLEDFRLPETYLDSLYDSKYMRHFYTSREIEAFRDRWSARQAPV